MTGVTMQDLNIAHDKKPLLPLAALMLAGAVAQPALAQSSADKDKDLGTVLIQDKRYDSDSKGVLRVRETEIGKGRQALRDIPQTVTVMTERLMSDRNLDDFREGPERRCGGFTHQRRLKDGRTINELLENLAPLELNSGSDRVDFPPMHKGKSDQDDHC